MSVIALTTDNFEKEVLASDIPVLVDFWAEWCGPCKMIGPIVEEIAAEMEGKLKVGKVNIDDSQGLAAKYNIMSIPTLMLFKDGNLAEQTVGALAKEQIIERIQSLL